MSISRLFMVLVCSGVGFSMGCGTCASTCSSKNPPTTSAATSVTTPVATPVATSVTTPVAPAGQLPHNGLPKNGIAPEVLQANQKLLERLKTSKLDGLQLNDVEPFSARDLPGQDPKLEPLAVQLMDYIVYFALNEGQQVSVVVNGKPYQWNGHMGKCASGTGPMGDWFNALPTNECLEAVSGSVLARVNALNKVVVLSMRGPNNLIALHDKVPVETRSREKNGSTGEATEIESFSACTGGGGPDSEDCGWSARYVGRCLALKGDEKENRSVTLKLKPAPSKSLPVHVRVCAGIHGCKFGDYPDADVRKKYIKHIKNDSFDSPDKTVEFTCPSNGPRGTVAPGSIQSYGYFSIMLSEQNPEVDVESAGTEHLMYPATEADVFRYREGAFYGNIFGSTSASDAGSPTKTLFDKQYACFGEDWKIAAANIADRLCAIPLDDPNNNCFFNVPNACLDVNNYPVKRLACNKSDGDKGFVYTSCGGVDPHWEYPITTYLNHPCDLRSIAECSSLAAWTFGGDSLP